MGSRRSFLLALLLLVPYIAALKSCQEACTSNDECDGKLACMSGKCNDDPGVGTHICSQSVACKPSGKLVAPYIPPKKCNTQHMSSCCKAGQSYDKYDCSPPVTANTKATLTLNGFGQGEDGGGASACPPYRFYSATDKVVALSTGWYAGSSRCGKTIVIKYNGRSSRAKVVDECDSRNGCDEEHAFQPPCKSNIMDASEAVWHDLGVNPDTGMLDVTWSML